MSINRSLDIDERALVKACLDYDAKAQRQLYDSYCKTMMAICFRYTKSRTDAEDVLQEGFVKVFNNLHQFSFDGPLGGWIRKIMINTAINYLKQNRNYQYDMMFSDDALHPITDDNPEITLQAKEIISLIRQLPTGYQTIFNLHAVEGFSHVEIAGMLGINDGTSRSQYAKARNLLIKWMSISTNQPKQNANVEQI